MKREPNYVMQGGGDVQNKKKCVTSFVNNPQRIRSFPFAIFRANIFSLFSSSISFYGWHCVYHKIYYFIQFNFDFYTESFSSSSYPFPVSLYPLQDVRLHNFLPFQTIHCQLLPIHAYYPLTTFICPPIWWYVSKHCRR